MLCSHFEAGRCGSCTLIRTPYDKQVAQKQASCAALLTDPEMVWLPAVTSAQSGFRNRAKMVVTGTAQAPVLGLMDAQFNGIDLRDCPLYDAQMQEILEALTEFITAAKIVPYDLAARRGELKYVLVTQSPDNEFLVRLVCRSQEPVTRIAKVLPTLVAAHPQVRVVSVNIQPHHKAVLEGDQEILLTQAVTLPMNLLPRMAGMPPITLHLGPQSFFQTNTAVATQMYWQAQTWIEQAAPDLMWDLFCGVGGFALHGAAYAGQVTGIEISPQAIASAQVSAQSLGLTNVSFGAADATTFSLAGQGQPDLVVVNPPRRGIGPTLASWLENSAIETVIYSSCNAQSLAADLVHMPSLRPRSARLLDMFPNTSHFEVMTLLTRS